MRLTLRYLLAYLDDYLLPHDAPKILDPDEFETIARKIEESEFARSLAERIQDVVRRNRLGAPSESDRGSGLDPNTVAEYLDNVLPDARVPDFEKVCLESDVQLAEVACCHQILAMVVTEPVEVNDETRQRIYRLPDALSAQSEELESGLEDSSVVEETMPVPVPPPPPPLPQGRRASRRTPYARPSRILGRRWSPLPGWTKGLIAIGLLFVGVLAWIWITGSGGGEGALSWMLAWRASNEAEVPADAIDSSNQVPAPTSPDPQPAADAPSAKSPEAKPAPTMPKLDGGLPPKEMPGSGENAVPRGPPPKPSAEKVPSPPPHPGAEMPDASSEPSVPAKPSAKPAGGVAKSDAEPMGLFVSGKEVLLRMNPKTGVWQRVGNEASVLANDRLISLPAFRPRLTLAGRTTLELVNATAISLLGPEGPKPAGIALEFGQLLAKADDAAGAALRLDVGDHSGVCRFADADSIVAVEASRARPVGDPETQPGPITASLYVVSGSVAWQDDRSDKAVKLVAGNRLGLTEMPLEPATAAQTPRWVSGEQASPLDQRAAAVLEREAVLGRPIILVLRELVGHRQREVRWLAMRSLALVEDYQPLLAALEDPEQFRFWTDQVEQLQAAVFRGPQSAANVRVAMERLYGPQGVALYEMLWKYRDDTLQPDDVNHLVDFLGHELLPFRVLGFWNLKNLSSNRMLGYRPEDPAPKRQAALQKLRERLRANPPGRGVSAPSSSGPPPSAAPPSGQAPTDDSMDEP
jgi:hypothetical protein